MVDALERPWREPDRSDGGVEAAAASPAGLVDDGPEERHTEAQADRGAKTGTQGSASVAELLAGPGVEGEISEDECPEDAAGPLGEGDSDELLDRLLASPAVGVQDIVPAQAHEERAADGEEMVEEVSADLGRIVAGLLDGHYADDRTGPDPEDRVDTRAYLAALDEALLLPLDPSEINEQKGVVASIVGVFGGPYDRVAVARAFVATRHG